MQQSTYFFKNTTQICSVLIDRGHAYHSAQNSGKEFEYSTRAKKKYVENFFQSAKRMQWRKIEIKCHVSVIP